MPEPSSDKGAATDNPKHYPPRGVGCQPNVYRSRSRAAKRAADSASNFGTRVPTRNCRYLLLVQFVHLSAPCVQSVITREWSLLRRPVVIDQQTRELPVVEIPRADGVVVVVPEIGRASCRERV